MKLIDADALRQDVLDLPNCYNGFSDTYDKSLIIGLIDEQIVVDAVHAVRCFECKALMLKAEKPRYMCCKFNGLTDPKPNDYCSYGERSSE